MAHSKAIESIRKAHPTYSMLETEVLGVPLIMFYSIYPGDDPTCPYPYVEDRFFVTLDGVPANWVTEERYKKIEDTIFEAYNARGKRKH